MDASWIAKAAVVGIAGTGAVSLALVARHGKTFYANKPLPLDAEPFKEGAHVQLGAMTRFNAHESIER